MASEEPSLATLLANPTVVPPACVTRWQDGRLAVTQQLMVTAPKPKSLAERKSKCSRSSRTQQSLSSARFSTFSGNMHASTCKRTDVTEKNQQLIESAYLQLCASSQVKVNSGIRRTLEQLTCDDGSSLKHFDANNNHLGENGLRIVFELIGCSQRISSLKLSQQNVTSELLNDLLKVLLVHDGVTEVDLSHNPLSITAARMLSDFAGKTQLIKSINLEKTHITDEWKERIASRLKDISTKRLMGLLHTPIYRSAFTHTYIRVMVISSDFHSFVDEFPLIEQAFMRVNSLMQNVGVSLIPTRCNDVGVYHSSDWIARAIELSRDSFNWGIPWVMILHDPNRDTSPACPPSDTRAYCDALQRVDAILQDVPPHPPLRDKNGVRRSELREQVPGVLLFEREESYDVHSHAPTTTTTTATATATVGKKPAVAAPPQAERCCEATRNTVRSLATSRLVRRTRISNNYLAKVFEAEVVSRVLVALEKIYSDASFTEDLSLVEGSATEHYPAQNLTCAELYNNSEPAFFKSQWFCAEQLLMHYQARPAPEQELIGYCERHEPESGTTYPLIVYGQTGIGKSTLLAWLATELLRTSEAKVLPVFIGHGKDTLTLRDLLLVLIKAVREAFEMPPFQCTLEAHALSTEWKELVSHTTIYRPRKIVIILAGLEALQMHECLSILPLSLNSYVRVVATVASHHSLLVKLRERVPQPYEILLSTLSRKECITILQARCGAKILGLTGATSDSEPGVDSEMDEGVIMSPSNPSDAVCFKDHGGNPLYIIFLAELLRIHADKCTSIVATLEVIWSMPETCSSVIDALLQCWEDDFGRPTVQMVLTYVYLRREGFSLVEMEGALRDEVLEADVPFSPAAYSMLWVEMQTMFFHHGDGLLSPLHQDLVHAIAARYNLQNLPTETYHCAMAAFDFKVLSSKQSSPFLQKLALNNVPYALLKAGRTLDAFIIVTDVSFAERQIQYDFEQLLSDCEAVEMELRRCDEAGIEGFSHFQFKASLEINMLRALRTMCLQYETFLRRFPSFLQVAACLPDSNMCRIAADKYVTTHGMPHPLVKWVNKASRPSLATSVLDLEDNPVLHVSFNPNMEGGLSLAATTRSAVYICDVHKMRQKLCMGDSLSAPLDGLLSSVFTPDGITLVTSAPTQILIWRPEDREVPLLHNILDHAPSITRPLSNNGTTIVAVQLATGKGAVIDTRKGRVISTLKPHVNEEPIRNIFFAQGTATVVSVGLGSVCVYTGAHQISYAGHEGLIQCCDVSSDGKLGCSADDCAVHLWSAVTGLVVRVITKHTSLVNDLGFHPNGHMVATCDALGSVYVWTAQGQEANREPVQTGIGPGNWVGFSPDGCNLLVRSETGVHTFETSTYTSRGVVGGSKGRLTFAASSYDMTSLATADEDGCVQLFTLDEQQYPTPAAWLDHSTVMFPTENIKERCDAHIYGVLDLSYSPDGRVIATVFSDGTFKSWNAQDGKLMLRIVGQGVVSAVFVPDSSVLILGLMSTLRLLDYKSGDILTEIPAFRGILAEEDGEGVRQLRISANAKRVAFTIRSACDKALVNHCHFIDIPAKKRVGSPLAHNDEISGIEYLGEEVVTCSKDATLRTWCANTQSQIQSLHLGCAAEGLSLLHTTIAVGLHNGTVAIFSYDTKQRFLTCSLTIDCGSQVTAVRLLEPLGYVVCALLDEYVDVYRLADAQCVASVQTYDAPRYIASDTRTVKGAFRDPSILVGGSAGYVKWFGFVEHQEKVL